MRIGTKSIWIVVHFKQVGLWFVHTLSFGSSPPLSRLSRLYSSPSTSFPFVHQTLSVSLLCFLYIMIYSDYLLCRSCLRIATKYKYLLLLVVLSWCEDRIDTGKDLALGELGRRHSWDNCIDLAKVTRMWIHADHWVSVLYFLSAYNIHRTFMTDLQKLADYNNIANGNNVVDKT